MAFHVFTKRMAFFDTNLRHLCYLKSYAQSTALLDVLIIRPPLVLHAAKRNQKSKSKSPKRDDCPVTVMQYLTIIHRSGGE